MKVAVMQPYFMPYLGYIKLIKEVDVFVFLDDVSFIKRGFVNRNAVLLDGCYKRFTLPVKNASINRAINEHQYVGDFNKFTRLIYESYKSCPLYDTYSDQLENLLDGEVVNVSSLNVKSLKWVSEVLSIEVEFLLASELMASRDLKGRDRIIEICHNLRADTYLNLPNGRKLYEKEYFKHFGLDVKFIESPGVVYEQFNNSGEFVPFLSVLDVMFNAEPKTIREKILI